MNIKVLYFSKGGNTMKMAEAIASELSVTTEAIPPAYPLDNVKLLFLGASIHGKKIDEKMIDYIKTLDNKKVKNAALFSASGDNLDGINAMKELLTSKGIHVMDESFCCEGKHALFQHAHPDDNDLKNVRAFAKKTFELLNQ